MRYYAFRLLNVRSGTQSRLYLLQVTCFVSLQDYTDIRVGDDVSRPCHDVSVAGLAHVNVPHDVPDVVEIHFGLEDTGDTSRELLNRHGHRQVWLRAANKIDRAKKSGALSCLQKGRGFGIVRLFVRENRPKPGNVELRYPVTVNRCGLANCRSDVEKLHQFEFVCLRESLFSNLLAEACRFHLSFDGQNVLRYLRERCVGGFALQRSDVLPGLIGTKINFRKTTQDHPAADQSHENEKVIAHQPASTPTKEAKN